MSARLALVKATTEAIVAAAGGGNRSVAQSHAERVVEALMAYLDERDEYAALRERLRQESQGDRGDG